jgi:hypothetical protein
MNPIAFIQRERLQELHKKSHNPSLNPYLPIPWTQTQHPHKSNSFPMTPDPSSSGAFFCSVWLQCPGRNMYVRTLFCTRTPQISTRRMLERAVVAAPRLLPTNNGPNGELFVSQKTKVHDSIWWHDARWSFLSV